MTIDVPGSLPADPPSAQAGPGAISTPLPEVLREITRGGLAGLIVGIVLAGIGGRLVMRLAALLVPGSAGAVTENGNVIGTITVSGTAGLVVFIGLIGGTVAGSVWVVIRPWLPDSVAMRAVVSVPIAVGLATPGLVDARNVDFIVLGHDPAVVASLVALVALFGPALVLVDRWLEGRLPHPRPTDNGIVTGYALVASLGTALTVLLVMPLFFGSALVVAGVGLVVVGLTTLASWWLRIARGRAPGRGLGVVGRAALAVATLAGLAVTLREVSGALAVG